MSTSTEAKIGKALIVIGVILSAIGTIFLAVMGSATAMFMMPLFGGFMAVIAAIEVIGIILGIIAIKKSFDDQYHDAGVFGIISSLLPPLNIFTLIGGILCLLSPEAKKSKK